MNLKHRAGEVAAAGRFFWVIVAAIISCAGIVRSEVLLQYFETEWDEIYRRLPEISEAGYEGLWIPPPCKSPNAGGQFAGGGNVGYSHFDKFDIGDVPQRGSLGTRYGTRGSLRNLSDNAHNCDIKVYPDIVMNHFGNGPDYRTYPGTRPNDFHGWWDGAQPGGYKRAPRMTAYDDISNGWGGTFQQELVSLIDLQLEWDNRFSTGAPNYATPPVFDRQPGQEEYYPYGHNSSESTIAFLNRWITWLGNAIDFDGCRFDAPKHVIADFFGKVGANGFNHEIQYNFDQRRGYTDGYDGDNEFNDLYANNIRRKDALIFSEIFIGSTSQVDYWRNYGVKMRFLDFPRKSSMIFPAFNNGDLAALSGFSGFSEAEGVVFCQSHDESPPNKLELAYAYSLLHVGLPVVFFTGNNLNGNDVNVKTWMKAGYGSALGDWSNGAVPNLVYIHNQFARGREYGRWSEGDVYIFERYDDLNSNSGPDTNEGLLLVGLNDSGNWQTRYGVQTAFASGTVLHDYTGHNLSDITVNSSGQVDLSIPPGNYGQGWVAYAPYNATANGTPIRFSPSGTMAWVVPGGSLTTSKTREVTRLTNDTVDIDVYFNQPSGGTVNNVVVKWGLGRSLNASATDYTNDTSLVINGFEQATEIGAGHWRLTADLTGVPDGLHLVKARCFNQRPGGYPALYQTFQTAVYVDRHGPDVTVVTPAADATVDGDVVAVITNADRTAYQMNARIDGGGWRAVNEVQKGMWKVNLSGLGAGSHTLEVQALEADWAASRSMINTQTVSRSFSVDTAGPAVSLAFANINNGIRPGNIELPFFSTVVHNTSGSSVKLYWDGYELPVAGSGASFTNTFDGRFISGGQTNRLYGCFVNGPHFFEAVAVNGGLTNRVTTNVTFNLYGRNEIDSDGDGLPDNLEMPYFSSGTAPGPNVPWPGDSNQDMIPNYGETWTRLNPMNADSDYDGIWDGDEDCDYNINSGDGVASLREARQGYLLQDNPYYYNIYDAGSKPAEITGSLATWSPTNPTRAPGASLSITYWPNNGPLSNASPVVLHIGYNNWTGTVDTTMSSAGSGAWQASYAIPETATNINFVFRDSASTIWDNNNNANWTVAVGAYVATTNYFTMDGLFDYANGYEVANTGMKIVAAVRSNHLYAATWSGRDQGNDHFLYVTDKIGAPATPPWGKAGSISFDKTAKPYLAVEQSTGAGYLNNGGTIGRNWIGAAGNAMEMEIDMDEVFGAVPEVIYVAAVAYGTADGGTIQGQCPLDWTGNSDLPRMEFQAIPVASIRDDNNDGVFDVGQPQMWTVVNGSTNDANYGLRRFFLDEAMGDSESITVILKPNISGVSNVELFSNLNRRDFAVLPGDEDPASVTPASPSSYYRTYPMADIGGGQYAVTLPVNRCGVYRINARYTVGGRTCYYTDNGLRRDCAVVVSPKRAREIRLYELNPMTAEATDDTFYGRSTFRDLYTVNTNRPDVINTNYFRQLGVNMVWLQPIHPIGSDNRQTDPSTGSAYDPGSPYAVRNYWQVNSVLGDPATTDQAMGEFTNFVHAMQMSGVGVMLDGTVNHSAWDCEVGETGQRLFPGWATNAAALIREARPQWYSKKGDHSQHASYYVSAADNDVAQAPDRIDFGKWSDAADFNYGVYDALVGAQTDDQRDNYLDERDKLEPLDAYHREVWQYFSQYPAYWLEKTGCPAGTPKLQQAQKGIAGLRCDFAQGLPSQFWEYTINKTRSIKWDFVFMAESLDGYRTVNGSNQHGVGYRSARQFDVLNENLVFYWRDNFFSYYNTAAENPATSPTKTVIDARRTAYALSPLLLNLTTHDELLPSDSQWRVLYAYAELAALDGVPLVFYGQEAGMQNDAATYTNRGINAQNNFARYETNFGKSIPNFKRYNCMTNVWAGLQSGWKTPLLNAYQRLNAARAASPALCSPNNYFLGKQVGGGYDENIFAVAKYLQPGASVASQDVVLVFVNNNIGSTGANTNRTQTFSLNATYGSANWFGLQAGHTYNVVDLASTTPTNRLWGTGGISGTDLINNGIYVGLTGDPWSGRQVQYLKLIDMTQSLPDTDGDGLIDPIDPDKDNDSLPDWWEADNTLNALVGSGDEGPDGDPDQDGMSNYREFLAGTNPRNKESVFKFTSVRFTGNNADVDWTTVPGRTYMVEVLTNLTADPVQRLFFGTANGYTNTVSETGTGESQQRFYRGSVVP